MHAGKIAIGGWSCKGLSKANPNRANNENAIRDGLTSSGTSFAALLKVLRSHKGIRFFIGENVDEICFSTSDNKDAVLEAVTLPCDL